MEQIIFHIDVNSAYLSWSALSLLEEGSDTDLREVPSIIGGDMEKRHGVVLAKSVPAKKYGIVTGEPIVNALRKCPTLILQSPDHQLYHRKSQALMDYLSHICPDIEQVSVDECFMDFTPIRHLYPSPEAAAAAIKDGVKNTFGFTVNIGISTQKVLAKMASDFQKPDRVHTLYPREIRQKMWPLPVSSLYMCGKSSVQVLHNLEIRTIGDLARTDKQILSAHLKSHGITLWEYANGIDASKVNPLPQEAKGIGNSTTLSKDVTDREEAFKTLLELAESVGSRLRKAGQLAGSLTVEIKYNTFRSVSHQTTLPSGSNATGLLYETACRLFNELWDGTPIRLLGIRSAKLIDCSAPTQLSLFDIGTAPVNEKLAALDKTLDQIRQKYGDNAVIRGSLLTKK
ncbi:MAG: DNA polymerase IV [Lachnospiraceae bacterium]|nr:DNA polymerase IV [Lachnospiraceae bacterium]